MMPNMMKRFFLPWIASLLIAPAHADIGRDGLGETIQIYTRLHSYVGKPSWLVVIRDIDNNQNIPYIFDITRGDNFWFLFTYGRNYLILTSTMHITNFRSRYDDYTEYKIRNFCNLESNGRIIRGESLYITVAGDLTTNMNGINCHISHFKDPNFTVVSESNSDNS